MKLPTAVNPKDKENMLTVMEFNTANYNDHLAWNARLPLIVSAIIAADADIIGLSEVRLDYSPNFFYNEICEQFWAQYGLSPSNCASMDTGQQILTLLQNQSSPYANAQIITNVAMTYSDTLWEGLSVISRLPILSNGVLQLSKPADCTDSNLRITQWAQIQLPDGSPFYLYNTHFALSQPCLVTNVKETLELMNQISGLAGVLIGDMNATPDNTAFQPFSAAGFADAWAQLNPNENGYTFPSWGPAKRIDYCWASSRYASNLITAALGAADCASGVVYASDHLALVTQFNIA